MTLRIAVFTTRAGQTSSHWAACLAWTLAAREPVLLIDCDMEGGTLADLLMLRTGERSIANCFGDRPATWPELEAQVVEHPERDMLRIVPGLARSYGYDIVECLRKLSGAITGVSQDVVIADLGHPLSHPGLRSPRAAAEAICSVFDRVFIVIRDDPTILARTISVLQLASPPHGELIICHQHGQPYRRAVVESLQRNVGGLPIRDVWAWNEQRARRMGETGIPATLTAVEHELNLLPVAT